GPLLCTKRTHARGAHARSTKATSSEVQLRPGDAGNRVLSARAGRVELIRSVGLQGQCSVEERRHITQRYIGLACLRIGEREIGIERAEIVCAGIDLKRPRQRDAESVVAEQPRLGQTDSITLRLHGIAVQSGGPVTIQSKLRNTFGVSER